MMSLEDREFLPFEQTMAIKNEKNAARYEEENIRIETGWNSSLPVRHAALHVLSTMKRFCESIGKQEFMEVIRMQEQKIFCMRKRYAVQIKSEFQEDYVKKGIRLAEKYAGEMSKI